MPIRCDYKSFDSMYLTQVPVVMADEFELCPTGTQEVGRIFADGGRVVTKG
jgi:hypothetical protein